MSCPLLNPADWSEITAKLEAKNISMLAVLKIVGQYVSPAMSKTSKCPRLHPWEKTPNRGLISHPSWWGFCQTLSDADGAFGTGAGQELPLLLSSMNLLSCLPCCACKCFSYRADLLYDTQDNFQHRSLALACFSSQPLTWHHVETPQNFLSSRPGQRHHSAREKLQHQCFTSALSAVVRPLITFQWYSSKMLQPKQTFQNPKLLVYDYCTWINVNIDDSCATDLREGFTKKGCCSFGFCPNGGGAGVNKKPQKFIFKYWVFHKNLI